MLNWTESMTGMEQQKLLIPGMEVTSSLHITLYTEHDSQFEANQASSCINRNSNSYTSINFYFKNTEIERIEKNMQSKTGQYYIQESRH